MGLITNHLRSILARQVDDHGIVVWYDPEGHYREVTEHLTIPDTTIARYDGSFFALRHAIEPLMNGLEPPRLLIYVPLDPAATHNALIEVEAAGVTMKPGQQPPARNTRLTIIARHALKPILGDEQVAAIEKQVDRGQLSLADLDALADRGEALTKGVVSLIFGTGNPQEVALAFLASDRHDADIVGKGAAAELAALLHSAFEADLPGGETVEALRARLARHVLATDLMAGIAGAVPTPLTTVKVAMQPAMRDACVALARTWRLRRDLRDSYVTHAERVSLQLGLASIEFARDQLVGVETFLECERSLQRAVEVALLEKATDGLVAIAKARQSSFWAEQFPDVQARWALIAVSGQLLLEADRLQEALQSPALDAKAPFNAYTTGDRPWCALDTYHRHLERRCHTFDFDLGDRHRDLEQLLARARHRYMEVGSALAERFLRGYHAAKFRLPGVLQQREIFAKRVKPKLVEGKTAYVWVDALRFEMARDLAQALTEDFEVEMEAALGTVPTITEVGMAALLPQAHEAVAVVAAGDDRLAIAMQGAVLKERKDRVRFLREQAGVAVVDAKLEDLLPSPKKRVRQGVAEADLILITSQEIDALCEGDNVPLARRTMDEMLHELRRAFRILRNLGVRTIVVAADHGHLFGDELGGDMKIDPPGGTTVDLHRRVWVGRGGAADPSYLRARLADFDLASDLEIAVPWNFAGFKVKGGARAYFHGGMSPQELIVPVMTLSPREKALPGLASEVAWTLIPGSQKISTRFFSVQVKGVATGLFGLVPPKVRVEIRAKGECISTPVSAAYGFEEATGDVQLKLAEAREGQPAEVEGDTVALMITKEPTHKSVSIHLLDARSGLELARLDKIEVAIAI